MVRADNLEPINVYIAGTRLPANLRWCHLVRGTWNPGILQLSRFFFENWPVKCTYYTTHYTLNVSRIRQFIENEECFREFYHGGCTRNSIPRTTTVTVFFKFCCKIPYIFRWISWVHITVAQSKVVVLSAMWGRAQNGSKMLFLYEKRLSNAHGRGLCEANAGYAAREWSVDDVTAESNPVSIK